MFELDPQLAADTTTIGDLPLCRVLLVNDCQYPWLILVPRRPKLRESYQLNNEDRSQLQIESNTIGEILMEHFEGDKLNIAALGNVVSQLHIHHIVRYKNDLAWPKPIWGLLPAKPYSETELTDTKSTLITLLSSKLDLQLV